LQNGLCPWSQVDWTKEGSAYPLHAQSSLASFFVNGWPGQRINSGVPGKTQKNGIPVCEFKKIELNIAGYTLVNNCSATVPFSLTQRYNPTEAGCWSSKKALIFYQRLAA
jgi:hypothetical protein